MTFGANTKMFRELEVRFLTTALLWFERIIISLYFWYMNHIRYIFVKLSDSTAILLLLHLLFITNFKC